MFDDWGHDVNPVLLQRSEAMWWYAHTPNFDSYTAHLVRFYLRKIWFDDLLLEDAGYIKNV